ncbi:tyrosine--tRNA ligase, mitochondrial-like isoform X2 [Halichondria panicea]|uniref:tyrosine--tRNA ligase, mitochondrial-like isoform X2 n=1 Tax=Halichondria panicea TaxID=6063 RepID=UPI00312BB88E
MTLWRTPVIKLCRRFQSSISVHEVFQSLKERDLVHQHTKICAEDVPNGCSVYVGFDPTAESLHTGNLMAMMTLLHFNRAGYQPIAVIGGATGLVGDPSGRSSERDTLAQDTLHTNLEGIKNDLMRVFNNAKQQFPETECYKELIVLNNASWWNQVSGVGFVADIAREVRLSTLLNRDSVKLRLGSDEGMNCAEFLYPVFQAYDFLHLCKHHNCRLQVGGADQFVNITTGCKLVRKATGQSVHGLTLPLLTSLSGEKLSKSTGNALWLSPHKTSPFTFYQSLVNTPDQIVERWLTYFSFLSNGEIQAIMREHEGDPAKYVAQKCLAENVTRLVHGEDGLKKAQNATSVMFGREESTVQPLKELTERDLVALYSDASTTEMPLSLVGELTLADLAIRSGAVGKAIDCGRLLI